MTKSTKIIIAVIVIAAIAYGIYAYVNRSSAKVIPLPKAEEEAKAA
jgi:flagellar basal body-associated protein FliL